MNPELAGEAVVDLGILAVFLMVLGVGGLVADYVFPRIPFIQRYIDSLPDYEDEKEGSYEQRRSARKSHRHCVRKHDSRRH